MPLWDSKLLPAVALTQNSAKASADGWRGLPGHRPHLGADLRTLEDAVTGPPLWDGDDTNIRVRNATTEEAEAWNHSLRAAVEAGEREAGDASWVSFLVAVRNPTYDAA